MTREELVSELKAVHKFIPGMCRVWSKRTTGDDRSWHNMGYAARGWHECIDLVAYYEEQWGTHYKYAITANLNACRPTW